VAENKESTLFDRVNAMAEELGLKDDERLSYIDQHMTKAGWKRVPTYEPPESGGGNKGSNSGKGWFAE
jgi:hypothetical protein